MYVGKSLLLKSLYANNFYTNPLWEVENKITSLVVWEERIYISWEKSCQLFKDIKTSACVKCL